MMESLQQMLPLDFLTHPAAIASLLLLVVLFLHWCGTRRFANLRKFNVPYPKPIPFLGNFLEARKYGGVHLMYLDYAKKYGKAFAVSLGGRPSLVVADPELLKQIMIKDFTNFRNRFVIRKLSPTFQKMVFSARDDTWKRIRNTLTPTFSAMKMKLMVPLMEKSCDTLIKNLEKIADSGQSVDMLDWFRKLTLEVILSTAFGLDANIQMGENAEMFEKSKAVFKLPFIVRQLARLPFGNLLLRLMSYLRGNKPGYFQSVAEEIFKTRRQQRLTGRKDLLQLMMIANEETTVEGVSRLSDDEVVAQLIVFLIAGYETSSSTLAFTLYHLAMSPDIQHQLRSEIKEAMESNAQMPLYDVVQNIEYLDCVIKEAQRLYPAAAIVNRECSKDYDHNGVHIPAGTEVVIPIYALHHDPDAWDDPEKFDPERFRGPAKETHHPFQFLPFGSGPRNCIGMRFALMEIKISLVKMLSKYKFVQSPETQVPLVVDFGASLSARDGVCVQVESII